MLALRRVGPALWIAAALCVVLPAAASGATTVGQTFLPTSSSSCVGGPDWEVMQTARASGPSYAIPADGVLTSWSFQAGADQTVMTLRVFRFSGAPNVYRVIADGSELKTIAASSGLHTFPTRVPVQTGDLIGIRSTIGTCGSLTGNPGDTNLNRYGTVTGIGDTNGYISDSGFIYDISATLEPDADGDAFGDETQDGCPGNPLRQDDCADRDPPETTITKGAPKKTEKSKVKFKFTSDEPGSTFECKLKGKGLDQAVKRFNDCASPRKYGRLDEDKFKFAVRATDAAGNVDPSPAKDGFRVVG